MKKNKLFVLGLVTVFVALVSLTLVSSTWAKYTTSAYGQDTARVAYWGFDKATMTTALEIDDLFKTSYTNIQSKDTDAVIAPGESSTATFKLAYTSTGGPAPEVAYSYVISTDESSINQHIENNLAIEWTLKRGSEAVQVFTSDVDGSGNITKSAWDKLLEAIEAIDGDEDYTYGELPDQEVYTVGWQWAYDEVNDQYDTNLGNSATELEVSLVIRITATQKD